MRIHCEDELYKFRKDLKDRVLKSVTVKTLLTSVAEEVGKYEVACDYDFTYDNFTIHAATGYDVLRKVQSETRPTSTCAEKPCTSIRNTPRSERRSFTTSP